MRARLTGAFETRGESWEKKNIGVFSLGSRSKEENKYLLLKIKIIRLARRVKSLTRIDASV